MQRTEKYYEADAFRREATGRILAVEPGKTGGKLALDGTVFYPEGGGQPADRGTLTLADGTVLHVTDVHESEGVIWHTVDALPAGAVPGAEAAESIDWEWRFDKMQQHTGEHILSGILHAMFGAENVGFHIGSEAVRMDTSVPISAEGLREAELAANRIVWQDVPVLITYPTPEELAALTYRSKKEIAGQVRIVPIPGADVRKLQGRRPAQRGLRPAGPCGSPGHAGPAGGHWRFAERQIHRDGQRRPPGVRGVHRPEICPLRAVQPVV